MAEQVAIDGIVLPRAGYGWIENINELWRGPDVRGANDIVPGTAGTNPNPRRATESRRQLYVILVGDQTYAGSANANTRTGLEVNLYHFRANVVDPTGTGDGTRTAVLTLPSGATKTGLVHVEEFTYRSAGPSTLRGVLTLNLVNGALA